MKLVTNIDKKLLRPLYRELREIKYLFTGKPKGKGFILMMHHILPEGAQGMPEERYLNIQPNYLDSFLAQAKKDFDIIPLHQVPQRISDDNQRKFLVLTLDDGCQSVYTNGLPIFERHNVPFTVFITTGFTEGICDNSEIQEEKELAMTWQQLETLKNHPLVTIGGHTVSHPKLAHLPPIEIKREIMTNVQMLRDRLGISIDTFAYPFGSQNQQVLDAIASPDMGITISVLATGGPVTSINNNKYQLPRLNLCDTTNLRELHHWRDTFMGL